MVQAAATTRPSQVFKPCMSASHMLQTTPYTCIHATSLRRTDVVSTGAVLPAGISYQAEAARRAANRRVSAASTEKLKGSSAPHRLRAMPSQTVTHNMRATRQTAQMSREANCSSTVLTYHNPSDAWSRATVRASSKPSLPAKTEKP